MVSKLMLSIKELSSIFKSAVASGSERTLEHCGILRPEMSMAEAYQLFARSNVDRWLKGKLLSIMTIDGISLKNYIDRKK